MFEDFLKAVQCLRWLPAYGWQRLVRRLPSDGSISLVIAVADHFEPAFVPDLPSSTAHRHEQERRLDHWCQTYPKVVDRWRDTDGRTFRHTYFYPAEQYDHVIIERLAKHCHDGWGEIEIHLHHGVEGPDTADNTRRTLLGFRDALVNHGCLCRWDDEGAPRYAFVHGNWALANSARNRFCGVVTEMEILAETGCYADLTLPSAPSRAQIAKINALYQCSLPLKSRAPHRRGRDLRRGESPSIFPLIVQGPLGIRFGVRDARWPIRIENGELTNANAPTLERLRLWCRMSISVADRPDWIFIKLHCHGMDPRDEDAMLGGMLERFLQELAKFVQDNGRYRVHFVTAREMVNIILAACDGREGSPGYYRDYRLRLVTPQSA